MITAFFQNLVLLIGLSVLYWVFSHPPGANKSRAKVLVGLWFGLIAIAGMMMSFEYQEGAIFDGRSIILTLAGLFGGLLPALISGVMATVFRIYLGGSGVYAGIATIVASVAIGLFVRWHYSGRPETIKLLPLFGIGMLVHLVMLACQLLFPWPTGLTVIRSIWLPVMVFFPLGFVVIGRMLISIDKRLLAEQQLRLLEYKYRSLFNNIQDAILVADTQRKVLNCNQAYSKLFGYTLDEIRGKDTRNVYADESQYQQLGKDLKSNDETAVHQTYTLNYKRKDGSVFPGETSVFYQKDEEGQLMGYIGLIRDISSKRTAEEKYRIAFKTSPDSININRLCDGTYVEINDGFTRLSGYTEEEVIGKTSLEINIWADTADREKLVSGLKKQAYVENLEAKFRVKDGSVVYGLMSASIIKLNNVPHILSITRDHTERKQMEESLRESEDRFSRAFKSSPAPLCISEIETGMFINVNDRWVKMLGYSREEHVGRTSHDLDMWVRPEERNRIVQKLNEYGSFRDEYIEFLSKDHGKIIALWSAETITLEGRQLMLSLIHDITERQKAENELRELKDQLEIKIHEQTREMQERLEELERFKKATIDREIRMKELRDEIDLLKSSIP